MGVYEGGFECAPAKGVGCKSISEVNEMVNRNQAFDSAQYTSTQYSEKENQMFNGLRSLTHEESSERRELNTENYIWYSPSFLKLQKAERSS